MDSRMVETRGGRTRVRVYEGGRGTPLVWLPGALGVLPDDPALEALAERFHVYAPLLPGFQDSEGTETLHGMLDFALWGFDVIEALGLDHPHLAGHSMGGMIAAEMAAIAPNDVARLTLVAPAGLWLDEAPIPDLFSLLPFELPGLLFHDAARGAQLLTRGFDFGGEVPMGAVEFASLIARFEDLGFLQQLLIESARRLGTAGKILFPIPERGLSERLGRVKAATTLVWGEEDRVMPLVYCDAFARLLPRARVVRVPAAGHMVPYEAPEAVIAALAG